MNEDSVESDVLDYGVDDEWVLTWLRDEIQVVALVEGDGYLGPPAQ
jgi:hypothetical protein